jgi:gentisate 1,2-dioxygenase
MSTNGVNRSLKTIEEVIQGASKVNAVPLWPQMVKYNPPKPNPKCIPYLWKYDEVRPYLVRAGELVKEKDAERRVLMLINPERGIDFFNPKEDVALMRVRGTIYYRYTVCWTATRHAE